MSEKETSSDFIKESTLVKITNLDEKKLEALSEFDCGEKSINEYLVNDALEDSRLGITKTWLYYDEGDLKGYFSLTTDKMTIIKASKAREKMHVKMNYKGIPSIQIHHFAIDKRFQKNKEEKNGQHLMDIVLYFIKYNILCHTGACLITVFSLKSAVGFYKKMGFEKTGDSRDQINSAMGFFTSDLY